MVDDPAPNAFATGRNPKHAAIAVTTGLLEKMNRVELEGVLAHELSHIKNYDILVTTVAVIAVGAIAPLADIGLRFTFWGGTGEPPRQQRRRRARWHHRVARARGPRVGPVRRVLMPFAMSRNREYLADASGVQFTRYPPGLISALEKLRDDQAVVHHATKATAQMWIEQPLEGPQRSEEDARSPVQQPVRHAPASRGPDQAPPGDVGDAETKVVIGAVVAVLVVGAAAIGVAVATGGGDDSTQSGPRRQRSTTIATTTTVPPTTRRRSRRPPSPGCPTPRARARPGPRSR